MTRCLSLLLGAALCVPVWAASDRDDDAAAASGIEGVQVRPMTATVRTPASVTVTASITDPSLVPGSVRLLRINDDRPPTVLASMNDDGLNGDQAAGDTVFTAVVTLSADEPTPIRLRVTARFGSAAEGERSPVATVFFQRAHAPDRALATLARAIISGNPAAALRYFVDPDKAQAILQALDQAGRGRLAAAFAAAQLVSSSQDLRTYGAPWTVTPDTTPITVTFTMWPDLSGNWLIGSW